MEDKIKQALEKIKPALAADGGSIEFVSEKDGVVKVRLTGACCGCPMASYTLKEGVERSLKKEVPGVKEVQSV